MRPSRYEVLMEAKTRFANRALKDAEVPEEALMAMVEAASFAPSCFNEQPWRFLIATGERREKLLATLTPQNQEWAGRAPALVLTLAKKTFTYNGKENRWHLSDTGCATGLFMMEAERRGITAHPMAGFNRTAAQEAFQIPDDFEIVHVMAIGWPGDAHLLSEKNQQRNHPQPRKAIEELLL